MSTREIREASAATFASGTIDIESADVPWSLLKEGGQPCILLDPDTVVRVAPMARLYSGWNNVHFSPQLRLPVESPVGHGMVVTLEGTQFEVLVGYQFCCFIVLLFAWHDNLPLLTAFSFLLVCVSAMARECVAVALSPDSSFQLGKTYVVHFGAAGNVSTVIRRRLETGTEAVDVTFPSRVCQERAWVSYWIALLPTGKLYVGAGKLVGQQCIGCLDDGLYHQLRPGQDAVRYVGLGNSALGRHARPLKMRNVCVTSVPAYLPPLLENLHMDLPLVSVEGEDSEETKGLMEEYQKECKKNRARALKFGIPYTEPKNFLQWSQARRLRANPEKGFITGMDITTEEELAKQEARKARFGIAIVETKRRRVDEEEDNNEQEQAMEEEVEIIPISQAWDNEALVRQHRTDPPTSLYMNPPPSEEKREAMGEFAMEGTTETTLVPEKIHIFSIDWAAFTQIRTDDIMVRNMHMVVLRRPQASV
jgi:hypothetical protein